MKKKRKCRNCGEEVSFVGSRTVDKIRVTNPSPYCGPCAVKLRDWLVAQTIKMKVVERSNIFNGPRGIL